VEVTASLPCYTEELVDRQRGKGVYEKSIRGLQRLNAFGYGSELVLNLVYNPQGPSLPPPQEGLEADYKRILGETFGVRFNRLLTLANMPIQRFGSTLVSKGQFNQYMTLLHEAHRDENLDAVMCRSLISVDWQGTVYDCDFNQMLDLETPGGKDIWEIDSFAELANSRIATGSHCFGCTAGAGSSCGGSLQ
jgi:radical SAM/Cys-rich protein